MAAKSKRNRGKFVRVKDDIYIRLKRLASENDRPIVAEANLAIKNHLKKAETT